LPRQNCGVKGEGQEGEVKNSTKEQEHDSKFALFFILTKIKVSYKFNIK
jgi:hypothetical protein